MRDRDSWSVSLGRWGGLSVRLHAIFLLFAALMLYVSWRESQSLGEGDLVVVRMTAAAAALVVLLLSVLAHELAHCRAAIHWDGSADRIVLGPLGGLTPPRMPPEPRAELAVQLAGPLANALICVLCIPLLLMIGAGSITELLHPLRPPIAPAGSAPAVAGLTFWVQLTFWVNWVLLVVNCAPAYPFDGARALAAGLGLLRPKLDRRQSVIVVARLSRIASAGLLILACFAPAGHRGDFLPPWFALVLLAIFLFFSAKEEERQEAPPAAGDVFGYDFSQGFTSLEEVGEEVRPQTGVVARWLQRRRKARRRRRQEIEWEEERRVDEILLRLHERGMSSLSHDDRLLLERVSARYRSRQGHRA